MANQTITGTNENYDSASISGLLNGETITIDGGSLTIDADARYNQQAAVPGSITISSTLGGTINVDGTKVWELYFSSSTGNVPTQNALGSNGVTSSGGATGELTRVWATGSLTPEPAGAAMPATGWIKLREKTGNFATGEVVTLPGGATITLVDAGKRSWIELPGAKSSFLTVPHLGTMNFTGDWYELGTTNGADDQTFQLPLGFEAPAVQVETASGSGVYEWWLNGANLWTGQINATISTSNNVQVTADAVSGAAPAYHHGRRVRENTINASHTMATENVTGTSIPLTNIVFSAYVKKETRQYCHVSLIIGTTRYGAMVDLDAGTIISNTTAGSPSNPASSISAVNNGWYLVTISFDKTTTSNVQGFVALSNSATPVFVGAFPAYAGSTSEGIYVGDLTLTSGHVNQLISDTDSRGKFFYGNANTGEITLAKRTNGTAGVKPATGRKVRIPNIFLTSAASVEWAQNEWNYTPTTSNYQIRTTGAGSYVFDKVSSYWRLGITAAPFSVDLKSSALNISMTVQSLIGPFTIDNCAFSSTNGSFDNRISLTSSLDAVNITSSKFFKWASGTVLTFSDVSNLIIDSCTLLSGSNITGLRIRTTGLGIVNATNTKNSEIKNTSIIGGNLNFLTGFNQKLSNIRYADLLFGASDLGGTNVAVSLSSVLGVDIDGFYPVDDLQDVNPVLCLVRLTNLTGDVKAANIGSVSVPWICSSANMQSAVQSATLTGTNFEFNRIYVTGTSSSGIIQLPTSANIIATNVWVDGDEVQLHRVQRGLFKGCRWTVSKTPQAGVYGTHWNESFTSTTKGQFVITGNEPVPATVSQCNASLINASGFTGNGNVILSDTSDTITWTFPDYARGHTGIAQQASGIDCFDVVGTNTQAFEFSYQIDKNTGTFSAWKHLVNSTRMASGGVSGTNSITINTADEAALIRKPQIGDYIQSVAGVLPAGTTITNVAGTTITTSNNFTVNATLNELFYFWSDIAAESISPSTGFKLKVKVEVNSASFSNVFSFLFIPTDTNATDYLTQYPLPFDGNGVITNIETGSRIQIYNVTTSNELVNEVVNATSYTYQYYQGTTVTSGDLIRIRLSILGKLPQTLLAVADSVGFAATSNAVDDVIYNANGIDGSTVTEFTTDYPNVQVDISDPDNITTPQRIYAWMRYVETTSNGIDQWFNAISANDDVNYVIDQTIADIKLDNLASTPVQIVGGRLYRLDGSTVIAATSNSVQMDPDRVYSINGSPADFWAYPAASATTAGSLGEQVAKKLLTTNSFLALKD